MKTIHVILLFVFMGIAVSCEKVLFSEQGDIQIVTYEYESFSTISIFNTFDVVLRSDSIFSIEVEGYDRYIKNISIVLDSNNLIITDENGLNWLTGYPRPKLRISFPVLTDKILMEYPINMTSADTLYLPKLVVLSLGKTADVDLLMDVEYFQLSTGSDNYGSYTLGGSADKAQLWARGSSRFDASLLQTGRCIVKSNTISDCWVNVSNSLEAQLNTSGNIFYSGNPEEVVLLEESGSGKLISVEN